MKVLHFIPVYVPAWQFGGPVLSVSRLCEGLVSKGINVEVVTTNAGLIGNNQIVTGLPTNVNGVRVTYYDIDQHSGFIRSRDLLRNLPSILHNVDLLHMSAIWQPMGIEVQKAAIERSIPILHSLRGALSPYSFSQGCWKKWPYFLLRERVYLERVTGLHVTSRQEEEEISKLCLRPKKWLLPNPVCLDHLKVDGELRRVSREKLGVGQLEPLLLVCGRQHHKKGLDLLPDVLAAIQEYRWKLLLIGEDSDGSGRLFMDSMNRLGMNGRVMRRQTMPANVLCGIYNAADLLLLPSRHENFGNVVIEALSCGCSIAVSDRTGVSSDLLLDAPNGYGTVLPRSKIAWITWLKGWLNSPYRASNHAIEWVTTNYQQSAVAEKTIDIYERIIKDHQEGR